MDAGVAVRIRFALLNKVLDERSRRLLAAAERKAQPARFQNHLVLKTLPLFRVILYWTILLLGLAGAA